MSVTTVGILGYGRFGQAFGQLLLEAGFELSAYDPQVEVPESLRASSVEALAREADILVLAMPLGAMRSSLEALVPFLRPEQLVLDVGSVKLGPTKWMEELLGTKIPWVATHPLFGPTSLALGERPLRVVVCPSSMHPEALERVEALFARIGCRVQREDPATHDRIMASTHALAFFVAKGMLDAGVDLAAEEAPPSFQAIARTVEAVRSDAGHLFAAIHRENPFAAEARSRLLDAMSRVDHLLLEEDAGEEEPSGPDPLGIPDLGEKSPSLREARELIDEIDRDLVNLLARRAQLARRARQAKAELGGGVRDPEREKQLLAARRLWAEEEGLDPASVGEIFGAILRFSRRLQVED